MEGQLDSGQLAFHLNIIQSREDLFLVKGFYILLSKTDSFLLFYLQRDSDCKLTFPNLLFPLEDLTSVKE